MTNANKKRKRKKYHGRNTRLEINLLNKGKGNIKLGRKWI